jgi:cysteine-S-conjugate beta-lyase
MEDQHTHCVHPIQESRAINDPVTAGVFKSTSYIYENDKPLVYPGFFSTYNQERLGKIMATHEKGKWGVVFNSGMAAISVAVLSFARMGDHVIFSKELYGGTLKFALEQLPKFGIVCSFAEPTVESYKALVRKNTRAIFIETPSNPLLTILPLRQIAAMAERQGIVTIIDNTLASSINQRPIEHGFDISIQSGTKYLGGHNDLQFGTLVARDEEVKDIILPVAKMYGGSLSPELCYQAERSLKTLALRVTRQNENAMKIAEFLLDHPMIDKVYYPGLPTHAGHDIALTQMDGFGGMVAFEINGAPQQISSFLQSLTLVSPALSLGGVESLICVPAKTSHSTVPAQTRESMGIKDNLLRLSAGIESCQDIIQDLGNALAAATGT